MATQVPPAPPVAGPPPWALACVPGLQQHQSPERVERLGGGTVNEVFRIDSAQGRFVLRLNGPAWRRPGVDRARELQLHSTAAHGGIAPAIIHAAPERDGLLIMEYQEGRTWSEADYEDPVRLRRLGERLGKLHSLRAPAGEAFDPLQVGQDYARQIPPGAAQSLAGPMLRLQNLSARLKESSRPPVVVHGDLFQGNILEGSRLWLLDWEYAQRSDPLMDIACLLAYYPQAGRHRLELAAAAGLNAQARRGELADRIEIYQLLSWLWRLARGENATVP